MEQNNEVPCTYPQVDSDCLPPDNPPQGKKSESSGGK